METKELIITDEIRKRLQGFMGFEVDNTFTYVPKVYREKDASGAYFIPKAMWPVFTLKSKDGVEIAEAEDNAGYISIGKNSDEQKFHMQSGSLRLQALEACLVSFKNLPLEDGRTLEWVNGRASFSGATWNDMTKRDVLRYLPVKLQVELQNAINERSTLAPEEVQGLG